MKTLMLLSVLAVAILGSGCAPVAVTRADASGSGHASCDVQRMAAVERAAERTYTQVYWVNCPLVKPHSTG